MSKFVESFIIWRYMMHLEASNRWTIDTVARGSQRCPQSDELTLQPWAIVSVVASALHQVLSVRR
jgi:hypothetical protein